jgi:Protein of unknown function (DUF4054)
MSATLAQFRHYVPEMASIDDATVELWLEVTSKLINPDLFGTNADMAQVWLACHHISTRPTSGGGGGGIPAVPGASSITVGPVSVTYSAAMAASVSGAALDRTVYGQRYEALAMVARACAMSLFMATGTIL